MLLVVNRQRAGSTLAVLCIVLAVLTRYIGVAGALVVGGGLLLTDRRRWRLAVTLFAAAPASLIVWTAVNHVVSAASAARQVAWHPGQVHLRVAVYVTASWFRLSKAPLALQTIIAILVLGGPIFVVVSRTAQERLFGRRLGTCTRDVVLRALALGAPSFFAVLFVTQVLFDATTPSDQRVLAPAQPFVYLALLGIGSTAVDACAAPRRNLLSAAGVAIALVLTVPGLARVHSANATLRRAALAQHQSRLRSRYRTLPASTTVFTNEPSGFWFYSGHTAYMLPEPVVATTLARNGRYLDQMRHVGDVVRADRGLVVVQPSVVQTRNSRTVARQTGLAIAATCVDGDVIVASSAQSVALPGCHAMSR